MELLAKNPKLFSKLSVYFSTFIRFLLNILMIIIIGALITGVIKAGIDLATSLHQPLEVLLQQILLDIVFIVALLEITLTILGYLKDGKVHVRYIVDTILIIMLNEIVTIWFKKPELDQMIGIAVIILALAFVRVTTIRFDAKDAS